MTLIFFLQFGFLSQSFFLLLFDQLLVVNILIQEFIDFLNVHIPSDFPKGVDGYFQAVEVLVDPGLGFDFEVFFWGDLFACHD